MDTDILNAALTLALEWGENFAKPVEPRLAALYPSLTDDELKAYANEAKEIKSNSFAQTELSYTKQITQSEEIERIKARFPGLSEDNLSMLRSQGGYYAWHEHGG